MDDFTDICIGFSTKLYLESILLAVSCKAKSSKYIVVWKLIHDTMLHKI